MALKQKDDFAGAETALRTAVALDPALPEAHFTLKVVLWQTGRPDGAAEAFAAAAARKAGYGEAHYMLGKSSSSRGSGSGRSWSSGRPSGTSRPPRKRI